MSGTHTKLVAEHFEKQWREYDRQIRVAIPFYDQALETLVNVIEASGTRPARILDIGVGTGTLAGLLLKTFPEAVLVGVDLVDQFLNMARERLDEYADRVSLVRADIADFDFGEHDLVVSSFTFHHLTDATKKSIYARVFSRLAGQGCFVNADYVDSSSRFYSRVFYELRLDFVRRSGGSEQEYVDHQKLEVPAPMETQLNWLRHAGFTDGECLWKYLNLAVFAARKA